MLSTNLHHPLRLLPALRSLQSSRILHRALSSSSSYSTQTQNASSAPYVSTPLGTVNPAEIAHFSRLSSEWWDEQGEFGFLHKMNPVRVQFVREKVAEIKRETEGESVVAADVLNGLDVLDVGCGGGLLSESLARLGANTTGVDASESNIKIAKLHASADPKLGRLKYLHTPAENLLAEPKRFDVVCSMEVLEHVDNPTTFLSTCAELVKPGGHLFLSTMARTPLSYVLTILLAEDILRKVSPGTHTHSKYINPSELVSFFQKYRSVTVSPDGVEGVQERTWVSPQTNPNAPLRTEAEVRGLIYNPLLAKWHLAPRGAWGSTECNYIFWVQKPL